MSITASGNRLTYHLMWKQDKQITFVLEMMIVVLCHLKNKSTLKFLECQRYMLE
jgi:hypothetical protein